MASIYTDSFPTDQERERPGSELEEKILPLYAEELTVSRRRVPTSVVRISRSTRTTNRLVEEDLSHERVEIERIPVGRPVDVIPPVRVEGDVTILPVVEEVLVTERRLVLKEEVHVRRIRTSERHVETVVLRTQVAEVTRSEAASLTDNLTPSKTDQPTT